jgi:hypothetical protein
MIIDTEKLPDGYRRHITQLMELMEAHAELARGGMILLKHHPEEGETSDGLDKALERVFAKSSIGVSGQPSTIAKRLYDALAALTACAKTSGPVGTTVYFISDERMNEAKAAALAWESSRGVITGSDETSPPSINS